MHTPRVFKPFKERTFAKGDFTHPEMSDDEVKGKVLHKFMRLGKIAASHTAFDNIPKGFPPEMRGRVKQLGKDMIREGLLLSKPTKYGLQVAINLGKTREAFALVEKFYDYLKRAKD